MRKSTNFFPFFLFLFNCTWYCLCTVFTRENMQYSHDYVERRKIKDQTFSPNTQQHSSYSRLLFHFILILCLGMCYFYLWNLTIQVEKTSRFLYLEPVRSKKSKEWIWDFYAAYSFSFLFSDFIFIDDENSMMKVIENCSEQSSLLFFLFFFSSVIYAERIFNILWRWWWYLIELYCRLSTYV